MRRADPRVLWRRQIGSGHAYDRWRRASGVGRSVRGVARGRRGWRPCARPRAGDHRRVHGGARRRDRLGPRRARGAGRAPCGSGGARGRRARPRGGDRGPSRP